MTVASLATMTHSVLADPPDAGDHAGARRVAVVEAVGGERAQLEEGGARVEQAVDALADGQLAALAVAGDGALVAGRATVGQGGGLGAQLADERPHGGVIGLPGLRGRIDVRSQACHRRR